MALPADNGARLTERMLADADQTASDADQTASDADQTASDADASAAASDQLASDADQALADELASAGEDGWARAEATRMQRVTNSGLRDSTGRQRTSSDSDRFQTAADRDTTAWQRDRRSEAIERAMDASEAPLVQQLAELRSQAAEDRARAAEDRASAARERVRLQAALQLAHRDDLTGVFRREPGRLALEREIERARRGDGRFILAFLDVDGLKDINDRDGHAAGDAVLRCVAETLRSYLRPFDPVARYGGDEFICGIGATGFETVEARFDLIRRALRDESDIGISVGVAQLAEGETLDGVTARADAALLVAKGNGGGAAGRAKQTPQGTHPRP